MPDNVIKFKTLKDEEIFEYDACSLLQELVYFSSQYSEVAEELELERVMKCLKKKIELSEDETCCTSKFETELTDIE